MICGIVCSLKYPLTTRMVLYTRDGIADRYDNYDFRSGYWSGNRTPTPVAIGLAIAHV